VLALAVVLVWRLRNIVDPVVGFSASYGLCLLATWLAASLSEGYYSMLLVPVLLTVITPGSPVASPLTWFAVWLFGGLDRWDTGSSRNVDPEFARPGWGGGGGPRWGNPFERDVPNDFERSRWTAGWLLLYAVLVVWAFRTHRSPPSQRSDDPRPADVGSEAPAGHVGSGVTG
jgi:hypothetical protein